MQGHITAEGLGYKPQTLVFPLLNPVDYAVTSHMPLVGAPKDQGYHTPRCTVITRQVSIEKDSCHRPDSSHWYFPVSFPPSRTWKRKMKNN